ncbi:hypothetical protein [Streptomyces sp. 891-h]|uniref:hypothetical protein n=1 Tax=unclassified Streptomyces TaxID=2593676 RepID=UPI001FAA97F7|nr:hypothetical protein [Streptomyces sp. 891-h]UNZ18132.1 hypothetical protein HC362_14815 [Streptomyces sp. 891-h]
MTRGEPPTHSLARAHLSQLIEMFGADGCLRISTIYEPDATNDGEAEDGEPA